MSTTAQEQIAKLCSEFRLWGSDYPHPDCGFPDSRQVIQEQLGQLDEPVRPKIVCGNAARLYGFE